MKRFQYIFRLLLIITLFSQMIFSPQVVQAVNRVVFDEELGMDNEKTSTAVTIKKEIFEEPFSQKDNSEAINEEVKTNQEYGVEINGPTSLSLSSNGTYEIMVKSMATPQNTLDGVILNIYIP